MASSNKQQQLQAREAAARLKRYEARQQLHATQKSRRVRDNLIAVIGVVLVATLAGVAQFVYFDSGPGAPTPVATETPGADESPAPGENIGAPDADLAEDRIWAGEVTFNDTVVGIELDGTAAPQAVAGFVQDFATGYYPGKVCHRLAGDRSFLQCGSIDGFGGPDPSFSYGPVENAPVDNLYPAGSIAMARQGGNGYSHGHQFFIVLSDTQLGSDAAGGYSIVGAVTSGLDELAALVADGVDPVTVGADGSGFPLQGVSISAFTIR